MKQIAVGMMVVVICSSVLTAGLLGIRYWPSSRPQLNQQKMAEYQRLWNQQQQLTQIRQLTATLTQLSATDPTYVTEVSTILEQLTSAVTQQPTLAESVLPALDTVETRFTNLKPIFQFQPDRYLLDAQAENIDQQALAQAQQGLGEILARSDMQLSEALFTAMTEFSQLDEESNPNEIIESYRRIQQRAGRFVIQPLQTAEVVSAYSQLESEIQDNIERLEEIQETVNF